MGHRAVVVTSALAGTTDALAELIDTAEQTGTVPSAKLDAILQQNQHDAAPGMIADLETQLDSVAQLGECGPLTRSRILATGERLALPLVAESLHRRGIVTRCFDGTELIVTDATATEPEARIDWPATRAHVRQTLHDLRPGEVTLVTGFLARDDRGRVRTLSRGASDLSATTLARALRATSVAIWTDVAGIMSANPRVVPQARTLPHLSYRAVTTLAHFGAAVLHPDATSPLAAAGIPATVRSIFDPHHPGTRIARTRIARPEEICAVTTLRGLSRLTVPTTEHRATASAACTALATVGISPLLVEASSRRTALVIAREQATQGQRALQRGLEVPVGQEQDLALIAAVAEDGTPTLSTVGRLIAALESVGIELKAVAAPPVAEHDAVVALVNDRDAITATRTLHTALVRPQPKERANRPSPVATPIENAIGADPEHAPGRRQLG